MMFFRYTALPGFRRNALGYQTIQLDETAYNMHASDIIHELFHVLGRVHEHVRPDRDLYVRVNWPNIREGKKYVTSSSLYRPPVRLQSIEYKY